MEYNGSKNHIETQSQNFINQFEINSFNQK